MRISVKPEQSYHLINHGPCNLVTTGNGAKRNAAPINWTMPMNNDPALILTVIEKGDYTEKLLKESGEFVINVMGESSADKVLACGRVHGDQFDKFERFGLTPVPCARVKAPYVKESVGHIECRLINQHPYDDVTIYVGSVLHAEVEEDCWDGKSLIVSKAKTIHHLTGGSFAVTERVITVSKPSL